jgi:hypothetical protein
MGPTDSKRPVQPPHAPAHGGPHSALGHLVSHSADAEGIAPTPGHPDATDGFTPNWESAWIDLGGEG